MRGTSERWALAREGIPALMADPAADLLTTTATLHAREPYGEAGTFLFCSSTDLRGPPSRQYF